MESHSDRADIGTLQAIGLAVEEEEAYRALLQRHGASAADIAAAFGWPSRKVQRVLSALELKGLATRSPERVPRYLPAPADIAIEALILKRQGELQRARLTASQLHEQSLRGGAARKSDQRIVELITGSEAQVRVYEQMQHAARHEFLGIERPPYVMGVANRNAAQGRAIARGVVYRNICDSSTLELPGALDRLRDHTAAGETTRVFSGVPLKLVVVDRNIALIPLSLERVYDASLLVRSSTLLDALCQLFEMMWVRATPLVFTGADAVVQPESAPRRSADSERLLTMLAAGLNDKTIAHELDISIRTLDRRVVELLKGLDARTRFQAGWLAASRLRSASD
ncbi:MAG: helix-turn-helix domain-containing protein [Dokdonella sp.]